MAIEKKPDDLSADARAKAEQDAAEKAATQAVAEGASATDEARKQDAETIKQQAEMRPYPSQEEADAMKSAAAAGAAPYATRQLKP